jgi:hypothetical protein
VITHLKPSSCIITILGFTNTNEADEISLVASFIYVQVHIAPQMHCMMTTYNGIFLSLTYFLMGLHVQSVESLQKFKKVVTLNHKPLSMVWINFKKLIIAMRFN